jgi:hypothetical protein
MKMAKSDVFLSLRMYQPQMRSPSREVGTGSLRVSTVYRVGSLLLSEGVSIEHDAIIQV